MTDDEKIGWWSTLAWVMTFMWFLALATVLSDAPRSAVMVFLLAPGIFFAGFLIALSYRLIYLRGRKR